MKIKIAFCILIKVLIAQHIYIEKEAKTVSFESVKILIFYTERLFDSFSVI